MENDIFSFDKTADRSTTKGRTPPFSEDGCDPFQAPEPRRPSILLSILTGIIILVLLGAGYYFFFDPEHEKKANIPSDASEYEDHHYKVYDKSMTWNEACDECEAKGGHLVTVNRADEQAFIEELVAGSGKKYHYWLGGSFSDDPDSWSWVTGERIPLRDNTSGYQNWKPGKPNNSKDTDSSGEHYLELQSYMDEERPDEYMQWNDVPDDGYAIGAEDWPHFYTTDNFGYICEWDE